jgi:oligopeptide/dipeptide ABC transporter ATP-binding protein
VDAEADIALSVDGLQIAFRSARGSEVVVQDVSFVVRRGKTVALVGESGSGKSVSCLALMGLLPAGAARVVNGSALLRPGQDEQPIELLTLTRRQRTSVSGAKVSMIFQEPMTSLNPSLTVGEQIAEMLRRHRKMRRAAAMREAATMLDLVGIPAARRRVKDYPHSFSGGMRQRVMIASALACRPTLLIADEPTTALDVTVQAQILDLLRAMQQEFGMSILFITHDLGVVADCADDVVVLNGGQVLERAPVQQIFDAPRHPYTEGLLASLPQLGAVEGRLPSIPGQVPAPGSIAAGCLFRERCPYALPECALPAVVPLVPTGPQAASRCLRVNDLSLVGVA